MLKATLHVHVQGDKDDYVLYSPFEFLDRSAELGYEVVAFTCHERVVITPQLQEHAHKLGIILIPGIELNLGGHILILNADRHAQDIKTLGDLREYRKHRPEIFTIAAHPFFPQRRICLQERIHDNLDILDGIEHSWFYNRWLNYNKPAKTLAKKHDLPYIATSDIHILDQLHNGHILIDSEKNIESILEALREKRFVSVAKPQGVFQMFWTFARMQWELSQRFMPWAKPYTVFEYDDLLPPTDQTARPKTTETDSIPRMV